MTVPTPDTIRHTIERTVQLWNEHTDKQAWLDAYESLAPGGLTFEDPVGTPVKRGREALAPLWDASPGVTITIERLIVCGNEAAAVVRNEGTANGHDFSVPTIETSTYGENGSLHVRVYLEKP
jgi:hypothetical protein